MRRSPSPHRRRAPLGPLVTIGLTAYNGIPWIQPALDSLLAQTWTDFELVISDDGSTDGTRAILRGRAARDPRIRYEENAHRLGWLGNANHVLDRARGHWFLLADSDDLWEPTYLETLLKLVRSAPRAVLAFADVDLIDTDGRELGRHPGLDAVVQPTPFEQALQFLRMDEGRGKANIIHGLVRRSALQEVGGYHPLGPRTWGIDNQVLLALMAKGTVHHAPNVLFHKRLQPRPTDPGAWATLRDLWSYHRALHRVVAGMSELSAPQRRRLHAAVRRKRWDLLLRRVPMRAARALRAPLRRRTPERAGS